MGQSTEDAEYATFVAFLEHDLEEEALAAQRVHRLRTVPAPASPDSIDGDEHVNL